MGMEGHLSPSCTSERICTMWLLHLKLQAAHTEEMVFPLLLSLLPHISFPAHNMGIWNPAGGLPLRVTGLREL